MSVAEAEAVAVIIFFNCYCQVRLPTETESLPLPVLTLMNNFQVEMVLENQTAVRSLAFRRKKSGKEDSA
jgi:hypothetical protein